MSPVLIYGTPVQLKFKISIKLTLYSSMVHFLLRFVTLKNSAATSVWIARIRTEVQNGFPPLRAWFKIDNNHLRVSTTVPILISNFWSEPKFQVWIHHFINQLWFSSFNSYFMGWIISEIQCNRIVCQKSKFWSKIEIAVKNWNFGQKLKLRSKIEISVKN